MVTKLQHFRFNYDEKQGYQVPTQNIKILSELQEQNNIIIMVPQSDIHCCTAHFGLPTFSMIYKAILAFNPIVSYQYELVNSATGLSL